MHLGVHGVACVYVCVCAYAMRNVSGVRERVHVCLVSVVICAKQDGDTVACKQLFATFPLNYVYGLPPHTSSSHHLCKTSRTWILPLDDPINKMNLHTRDVAEHPTDAEAQPVHAVVSPLTAVTVIDLDRCCCSSNGRSVLVLWLRSMLSHWLLWLSLI